ncbi:FHA domain-containing protein [Propionicicella superfundia]|uniref:FHA domain-containing protein n=1 Tax=Propionicicella superfundia TaxID=348582 RepID=UPI000426FE26|nr:FHA domain-containing protein [Propionicicella superfundia]
MTERNGRWRATYSPGPWVVLSGPTLLVVMPPAAPKHSELIQGMWASVVASGSVFDLTETLTRVRIDALPDFGAFFWADGGMRSLLRGSIAVRDADSGAVLATGDGVQTWSEIGLGDVLRFDVTMTPGIQDGLRLPLVTGAVTAGEVHLDCTDEARLVFPERSGAEPDEPAREEPLADEPVAEPADAAGAEPEDDDAEPFAPADLDLPSTAAPDPEPTSFDTEYSTPSAPAPSTFDVEGRTELLPTASLEVGAPVPQASPFVVPPPPGAEAGAALPASTALGAAAAAGVAAAPPGPQPPAPPGRPALPDPAGDPGGWGAPPSTDIAPGGAPPAPSLPAGVPAQVPYGVPPGSAPAQASPESSPVPHPAPGDEGHPSGQPSPAQPGRWEPLGAATPPPPGVASPPPQAPAGGIISGLPSFGTPPPAVQTTDSASEHDGETIFATGIAATHKAGVPTSPRNDLVLAAMCGLQHPNPPDARVCARCGGAVDGSSPRLVALPVLAVLRASTGQSAEVGGVVLVGRAPQATPSEHDAVLLSVPSPSQDISRTHLRVAAVQWEVVVTDLHSTNGTVLVRPGEQPVRMAPGEPVAVGIGTILDLGDGVAIRVDQPL